MKVEELNNYGKSITEIVDATPKIIMIKIGWIIIRSIITETGIWGFIPFMINVNSEKMRIKEEHADGYSKALKLGKEPANQFLTMTAMFNVVAKRKDREAAYNFTKSMWQQYAKYTIPLLYNADNLVKCEGDTFSNYKKFNIALFNSNDDYHVKEIKDEEDCLTIIVDKCASAEIANALGCPEVGMLGCDHDVAGYPYIEDKVNSEFRRLHTIAKGDDICDFMFFRKGSCPYEASLNK
ncbi:MAG: hypothetical protein D6830_00095 [Ignavibacteria bacterium]|nr:MAG: hypothetical protein D6830_00095 [Ignavibacteria bacterium]